MHLRITAPNSAAEAPWITLVTDGKRLKIWHLGFSACGSSFRQRLFTGPKSLGAPEPVLEGMVKSGVKVWIGADQNVGSGDVAYVYGPYSVLEHEGGQVTERGAYVEVWRQRGGVWQIDLDVNAAGPSISK